MKFRALYLSFLWLAAIALPAQAQPLASISEGSTQISLRETDGRYELSIKLQNGINLASAASVFAVDNPPRLVVDLPHVKAKTGRSVPVNHPHFNAMRMGVHADKVRLVIDLKGMAVPAYVVTPDAQGNALVVSLDFARAADESAFAEPTPRADPPKPGRVRTPEPESTPLPPEPEATEESPLESDDTQLQVSSPAPTPLPQPSPGPVTEHEPKPGSLEEMEPAFEPSPSPTAVQQSTSTPDSLAAAQKSLQEEIALATKQAEPITEPPAKLRDLERKPEPPAKVREIEPEPSPAPPPQDPAKALEEVPLDRTPPAAPRAVIGGIYYQSPRDAAMSSVLIDVANLTTYKLQQRDTNKYELVLENAVLAGEHLTLPQFPPDTFNGFEVILARNDGANVIIDIYVEDKVKVSPFMAKDRLWLKSSE